MAQRLFYRTKYIHQSEGLNHSKPNVLKRISVSLALVIVVGILAYAGYQNKGNIERVTNNWQEIQFAYEQPELVHQVRASYHSQN